jgi:hypothetical protein
MASGWETGLESGARAPRDKRKVRAEQTPALGTLQYVRVLGLPAVCVVGEDLLLGPVLL